MNALPAWNNTSEYPHIESSEFMADYEKVLSLIDQIEVINLNIAPLFKNHDDPKNLNRLIQGLQESSRLNEAAYILTHNLRAYVYCEASVDATNAKAQQWTTQIQKLISSLSVCSVQSEVFLKSCDDSIIQKYLASEDTKSQAFQLSRMRVQKDFLLSPEEEKTVAEFEQFGLHSWGNLRNEISGKLMVKIPGQEPMGIAQASGGLTSSVETERKEAWIGIQSAWKEVQSSAAAVLNNLAGYRLELYRKRSHTKTLHFLDPALLGSQIEAKTLQAMESAIYKRIESPRKILRYMAKTLKKEKLDPWDLFAPIPGANKDTSQVPFENAIQMITDAFSSIEPKMGEFVQMMLKNEWIEARVKPNKASGGYCTKFMKSRTPRIFQTYNGSMKDVSTLAHELGHAYHSWVMRDLPVAQSSYPMPLAETASIFSETLLNDVLIEKGIAEEKRSLLWDEMAHSAMFLINIFARFEFEKNFYEARKKGVVSAEELNELTDQAWKKWYGDTLTESEKQYWMTKMHFSISSITFYNFPYTFGYLFALGIYAQKDQMGSNFSSFYTELLRDTGRMTAEELVQKHLGMDIREEAFWNKALDIVDEKIKKLVQE